MRCRAHSQPPAFVDWRTRTCLCGHAFVCPQLSLRTINSAKTAFQLLDIKSTFFSMYTAQQETYHCKVNAKDFASAFQVRDILPK